MASYTQPNNNNNDYILDIAPFNIKMIKSALHEFKTQYYTKYINRAILVNGRLIVLQATRKRQ